jgi:hypothetical protein
MPITLIWAEINELWLRFLTCSSRLSTRTELMRHFDLVDFESGRGEKRRPPRGVENTVVLARLFNEVQAQKMPSRMVRLILSEHLYPSERWLYPSSFAIRTGDFGSMPIDLIVEWRLRSTAGVRSVFAALGLAITLNYSAHFSYLN